MNLNKDNSTQPKELMTVLIVDEDPNVRMEMIELMGKNENMHLLVEVESLKEMLSFLETLRTNLVIIPVTKETKAEDLEKIEEILLRYPTEWYFIVDTLSTHNYSITEAAGRRGLVFEKRQLASVFRYFEMDNTPSAELAEV